MGMFRVQIDKLTPAQVEQLQEITSICQGELQYSDNGTAYVEVHMRFGFWVATTAAGLEPYITDLSPIEE
jgi:hypothetical protein